MSSICNTCNTLEPQNNAVAMSSILGVILEDLNSLAAAVNQLIVDANANATSTSAQSVTLKTRC